MRSKSHVLLNCVCGYENKKRQYKKCPRCGANLKEKLKRNNKKGKDRKFRNRRGNRGIAVRRR